MVAKRISLMIACACLSAPACTGETQERPLRSAADSAPRAPASPAPLPDTAFRSDEDVRAGHATQPAPAPVPASRFETRRIGHEEAPSPRFRGATVDLDLKGAELANVFRLLADVGHVNIVVAGEVTGTVTLRLRHVPWDQALDVIVRAKDLVVEHDGNVILITPRKR